MAAAQSACCRGCPSSCACDRQDKWSDSSLLGKRLSEDSSRHRLLQKWASMWSTSNPNASEAGGESAVSEETEAAAGDNPLVFLCARCRRPLGDSLSWVTSQEDTNCILLRCQFGPGDFQSSKPRGPGERGGGSFTGVPHPRSAALLRHRRKRYSETSVSCNVYVDKEQKLSKRKDENGCVLETLYCSGCSLSLGYVYRCTPKSLDYKRDLFCLSVEAIESYTLGSSEKQIVSEDKELFNLESRVEIEKSLKQMEDVLTALQTKLWEVESKLSFASCNV